MKSEFCPDCGRSLKTDKVVDQVTAIMKCKYCQKTFKFTYDEKMFPSNINSFNWGAFLLGAYWGFWNGSPIYALVCWTLNGFSITNPFSLIFGAISLSLGLYYGFRGNKISWSRKQWASFETFEKTQKYWGTAGAVVMGLSSIIIIVINLIK